MFVVAALDPHPVITIKAPKTIAPRVIDAVNDNIYKVKTFTEKPDLELAKTFISSGDFLWNAGIFVWQTKNIIAAFERHLPEIHEIFDGAQAAMNTTKEKEAIELIYPLCENISIDYAVMEKAENVFTVFISMFNGKEDTPCTYDLSFCKPPRLYNFFC